MLTQWEKDAAATGKRMKSNRLFSLSRWLSLNILNENRNIIEKVLKKLIFFDKQKQFEWITQTSRALKETPIHLVEMTLNNLQSTIWSV